MRSLRISFAVLAAVVLMAGLSSTALAFHSGGVAECIGCHSMHAPDENGEALLILESKSSTCLSCHEADAGFELGSSYHIATDDALMPVGTAPGNLTPGGDFGWIKKTYNWSPPWGGYFTEEGDSHGHNIIATSFGYDQDALNTQSPGGTFPSNQLGCESCHDPHGTARRLQDGTVAGTGAPIIASGSYDNSPLPGANEAVGVYRLLGANGYNGFTGAPMAVAPATYNRSEASTQTRVSYGFTGGTGGVAGMQGWADWCGTCHADMHSASNYVHPVDANMSGVVSNYNSYIMTGNMTGGSGSSFLSLAPFAKNSADFTTLAALAKDDDSQLGGPVGADKVTCFSCHRAHASGFEYALRWNPESEFLTYNSKWPGNDNGSPVQFARGRTEAEMTTAYYERPASTFASYQRSLCNKCHAKD